MELYDNIIILYIQLTDLREGNGAVGTLFIQL